MNAEELANKFKSKMADAITEKNKQVGIATSNAAKGSADVEHCKNAMEREVIPFQRAQTSHGGRAVFIRAANRHQRPPTGWGVIHDR